MKRGIIFLIVLVLMSSVVMAADVEEDSTLSLEEAVAEEPEQLPAQCEDSDAGRHYGIKSVVAASYSVDGSLTKEKYEDVCEDESNLVEYYCLEQEVKEELVECPGGCQDGACVSRRGFNPVPLTRKPSRDTLVVDLPTDIKIGNLVYTLQIDGYLEDTGKYKVIAVLKDTGVGRQRAGVASPIDSGEGDVAIPQFNKEEFPVPPVDKPRGFLGRLRLFTSKFWFWTVEDSSNEVTGKAFSLRSLFSRKPATEGPAKVAKPAGPAKVAKVASPAGPAKVTKVLKPVAWDSSAKEIDLTAGLEIDGVTITAEQVDTDKVILKFDTDVTAGVAMDRPFLVQADKVILIRGLARKGPAKSIEVPNVGRDRATVAEVAKPAGPAKVTKGQQQIPGSEHYVPGSENDLPSGELAETPAQVARKGFFARLFGR